MDFCRQGHACLLVLGNVLIEASSNSSTSAAVAFLFVFKVCYRIWTAKASVVSLTLLALPEPHAECFSVHAISSHLHMPAVVLVECGSLFEPENQVCCCLRMHFFKTKALTFILVVPSNIWIHEAS